VSDANAAMIVDSSNLAAPTDPETVDDYIANSGVLHGSYCQLDDDTDTEMPLILHQLQPTATFSYLVTLQSTATSAQLPPLPQFPIQADTSGTGATMRSSCMNYSQSSLQSPQTPMSLHQLHLNRRPCRWIHHALQQL